MTPDIHVDCGSFRDGPARLIERAVRKTLEHGGSDMEVSVALLPDDEMRRLNKEFLAKDGTTDVLAFSLAGGGDTVGDVYLGFEQAARQAADVGVSLREELARLAIHGTLHVLGHDHPEGSERSESEMFRLQERLLRELLEEPEAP